MPQLEAKRSAAEQGKARVSSTDPVSFPVWAVSANHGAAGLTHAVWATSESTGPAVTFPAVSAPARSPVKAGNVTTRRTTNIASAQRLTLAQRIDTRTP